jgi:hypothetical protein
MSVEAISWALNQAPVPADRGGQSSSACKFVLVGLANHAGPDGTGAFPSVATLVRYTGLSERTVRTCLDRLQVGGIISPCDPNIVAARIKRADRRPQGWDLDLSLARDDLDEPGAVVPHGRTGRSNPEGHSSEVQSSHPAVRSVDNVVSEVQSAWSRGAAVAPEPSIEPSLEPSAADARAREPAAAADAGGGGQAGDYFAVLGTGWQLTASQRARLVPAVTTALSTGWTPASLAAFTGSNSSGVRNPYAVLAARLSPAELPEPPTRRPMARPPWCGTCDEPTRRRQDAHGADAGRCPSCHPLAVSTAPARPSADCGGRSPSRHARPARDSSPARARGPKTACDADSGQARWPA